MPRKKLIRCSEFPYHITNRSNNREFFYLEMDDLWFVFVENLHQLKIQFQCEVYAFVLMSNHYHLLMSTPKENLGEAMKFFHREVARHANKKARRENHFFGGRYKWSVIGAEDYYWNATKYVFRNPVKAGICKGVSDYPYSSLNRQNHLVWKMTDFFRGTGEQIELDLDWLNEPFLNEHESAIQKALRRREFKIPRSRTTMAPKMDAVFLKKGTVTF